MLTKPDPTQTAQGLRAEIVGIDLQVALLGGRLGTYTNLDNAASTPPLQAVKDLVDQMMPWYSSVHRGAGFKSLLSTHLYDQARQVVMDFVGADPETEVTIFGKNTTEALNKLAARFPFQPGDIVLTTQMEHHSNDLPWRSHAQVAYSGLNPDGSLDLNDLENKLKQFDGKVKLVTLTGASNVSGFVNPLETVAELAHRHGAMICADCAQLAPHRPIQMGPAGTPQHLDFVAFSGHKLYAPFGGGALIGPYDFFATGAPDYSGGGTIDLVTAYEVQWADPPERDEAGSPNVIGIAAMAAATHRLMDAGMESIAAYEADLTRYALRCLNALPGIRIYGSADPDRVADRLGVITFDVAGMQHGKVAAILGYEGGIGVRDGCFCAHPYVLRLLKISPKEFELFRGRVLHKDRTDLPGMLRMSFSCYNNEEDVDRLVEMLTRVITGDYRGDYVSDPHSGSYTPRRFDPASLDAVLKIY